MLSFIASLHPDMIHTNSLFFLKKRPSGTGIVLPQGIRIQQCRTEHVFLE
jgi:hypothetical protein